MRFLCLKCVRVLTTNNQLNKHPFDFCPCERRQDVHRTNCFWASFRLNMFNNLIWVEKKRSRTLVATMPESLILLKKTNILTLRSSSRWSAPPQRWCSLQPFLFLVISFESHRLNQISQQQKHCEHLELSVSTETFSSSWTADLRSACVICSSYLLCYCSDVQSVWNLKIKLRVSTLHMLMSCLSLAFVRGSSRTVLSSSFTQVVCFMHYSLDICTWRI